MPSYTLNVNGQSHTVTVSSAEMPLLWVLRDVLNLTGTKYGCGIEVCGACTVMVNGQAEKSCDMDVSSAVGKTIVTIEGLSKDRSHPAQQAWIKNQVPQCGYCQSGMLMSVSTIRGRVPAADSCASLSTASAAVAATVTVIRPRARNSVSI